MTHDATVSTEDLVTDLIRKTQALAPVFEAEAPGNDRTGQLSDVTINALRDAGLFNLLAPLEFGGFDLGPFDAMRVVEEACRADGSAGWIVMVQNTQLRMLTQLPFESAEAMYADGMPGLAGQGSPKGSAVKVEGGYRITGQWSYGSNIKHATYVSGTAFLTEGGAPVKDANGIPRTVRWTAPREDVELRGNWDVLGLRASGSLDYELKDVFVPTAFTMGGLDDTLWGEKSRKVSEPRRVCRRLPFLRRWSNEQTEDKAEAAFRSARAWNYEVWREIQATAERDEAPTRWQYTLARAALQQTSRVNLDNAAFAFREGGGTSLRDGPMQRTIRDTMTSGQHVFVSRKWWGDCAKDFLGEAEGFEWSPLGLTPPLPKS
jgi:indole-3-acetate monooxygenase